MAVQLGKITREHDLRTVWSNEAQAFTPWLAEHLDVLGDALGEEVTGGAYRVAERAGHGRPRVCVWHRSGGRCGGWADVVSWPMLHCAA